LWIEWNYLLFNYIFKESYNDWVSDWVPYWPGSGAIDVLNGVAKPSSAINTYEYIWLLLSYLDEGVNKPAFYINCFSALYYPSMVTDC